MDGSSVDGRARPRGELELELPLPGLYNVYNALAAIAAGLRARGRAGADRARRSARCAAAFGRVETIEVGGKPVSILLIKNPAGANEVLRTLRLEAGDGGLDLWIAPQRPDRRRPRRLLDLGRRLRAARRPRAPRRLRRHAGAGDGAAAQVRGLAAGARSRSSRRSRPRSTRRSPRRPSRLFALPTYTALLELRKLLADRGLARGVLAMSAAHEPRRSIWHDVECGAYERRPAALGGARRRPPAGPILELGCGTGRVALHLARRGHRGHRRSTATRELVAALRRARGRRGSPVEARRRRRPRVRPRATRSALVLAPMQLLQLLDGRERARRRACAASPATCAPGGALRGRDRRADARPPDDGAAAAARRARGRRLGLLEPAARGPRSTASSIVRRLRQTVSPTGELERGARRGPHLRPARADAARGGGARGRAARRSAATQIAADRRPRRLDRRRARGASA